MQRGEKRRGVAEPSSPMPPQPGQKTVGPPDVPAPTPEVLSSPPGSESSPQGMRCFHPGIRVGTIACSPDGKLIAVGNHQPMIVMTTTGHSRVADNWQPAVRILDATTGRPVSTLELVTPKEEALLAAADRAPIFEVRALAFSPDASMLAVGTTAGQVKLFDPRSGKLVRTIDDPQGKKAEAEAPGKFASLARAMGSVRAMAFSPDGRELAVGGDSFADAPLLRDRVVRGGFTTTGPGSFGDGTVALAGQVELGGLRTTGPGRLKLWDLKSGKLKCDIAGHSGNVVGLAFSPDGKVLASTGDWLSGPHPGRGVKIWDLASGALAREVPTPDNGFTCSAAFSPDGKLLAIGSQRFDKDKSGKEAGSAMVRLAHVASGITEWVATVPGLAKTVAFAPDGRSIVVLCLGHAVRLLDTGTGRLNSEIKLTDRFLSSRGRWEASLSVAPHANLFVISGVDEDKQGCVEVWDFPGVAAQYRGYPPQLLKAKTKAERVAVYERMVANLRELEEVAEAASKAGVGPVDDVLRARAERLNAEARLANEKKGVGSAAAPNVSTPKGAAIAFAKAIEAGDLESARSLAVGTDAEFAFWKSMSEMLQASKRLQAAATKRFGEIGPSPFGPSSGFFVDHTERLEEKIEGNRATLVSKTGQVDWHTPRLKRVGDGWKMDLSGLGEAPPVTETESNEKVVEAMDAVAKNLESGKYKNVNEAIEAWRAEMLQATGSRPKSVDAPAPGAARHPSAEAREAAPGGFASGMAGTSIRIDRGSPTVVRRSRAKRYEVLAVECGGRANKGTGCQDEAGASPDGGSAKGTGVRRSRAKRYELLAVEGGGRAN